jgi:hypothetical protein
MDIVIVDMIGVFAVPEGGSCTLQDANFPFHKFYQLCFSSPLGQDANLL